MSTLRINSEDANFAMEDIVTTKKSVGTPCSQASTAPNTPAAMMLADPVGKDLTFVRLASGDSHLDPLTENEDSDREEFVAPWPPVMDIAEEDDVPRLCVACPPLQSDLGRRAQWAVRWEELHGVNAWLDDDDAASQASTTDQDLEDPDADPTTDDEECQREVYWPPIMPEVDDEQPRVCIALPPLQSDLGKWAQWVVRWEEEHGPMVEDEDSEEETEEEDDDDERYVAVDWPPTMPDDGTDENPRIVIGVPPLQSDLALWAQWAVRWEEANGCNDCGEDPDDA